MQRRIARHDRSIERPFFRMFDQFLLARVVHDIKANSGECASFALFLVQDVIVRLVLKTMRSQRQSQVLAQKFHPVLLVEVPSQSHPDEVNVIWHQAVSGTGQAFACRRVKHDFAKAGVKSFVEPARAAPANRQSPMHDGIALVIFERQSWKIKAAIRTLTAKRMAIVAFVGGLHKEKLERIDIRCYPNLVANVSWIIFSRLDAVSFRSAQGIFERTDVRCYAEGSIQRELDHLFSGLKTMTFRSA